MSIAGWTRRVTIERSGVRTEPWHSSLLIRSDGRRAELQDGIAQDVGDGRVGYQSGEFSRGCRVTIVLEL